jgi:hypothetical protein
MSEKVVDAFRTFVAGDRMADKRPVGDDASVQSDLTKGENDSAFAHRLSAQFKTFTQENAPLLGGTVELVGLDDVRKALGPTWAEASAKVGQLAEAEIQRSLSQHDFYKAYGTSSFLICFVGMDKTKAEKTAAQIVSRIKERLAVQFPGIAREVQPEQFVAEIEAHDIGSLDHDTLVERLFQSLVRLRENHDKAVSRFRSPMLRRSKLLFSPAWHASKEVIAFNRCSLDLGHSDRLGYPYLSDYTLAESQQFLAELDFVTFSRAVRAMYTLLKQGRAVTLLVPVRFSTITGRKSGPMYQRLLQTIRPDHLALLAIEIRDLPMSEDPGSVLQKVSEISPLVRWLAVALDIKHLQPEDYARGGLWAISVELSGWKSTDPSLRPALVKLRNAATNVGANTIAHGANSIGLALVATEAGLTYISGAAIHPATHEPRPPSPLHPVLSILPQNRVLRSTV